MFKVLAKGGVPLHRLSVENLEALRFTKSSNIENEDNNTNAAVAAAEGKSTQKKP